MKRTNKLSSKQKFNSEFVFTPLVIKCGTLKSNSLCWQKGEEYGKDTSSLIRTDLVPMIKIQQIHQDSVNGNCPSLRRQMQEKTVSTPKMHRKNIYRSRKEKKMGVVKPQVKPRNIDNTQLIVYFRYQTVSLFTLLGRREEYLNSLRKKSGATSLPLTTRQIEERLQTQIDRRGKDKPRKNFSHVTNEQLRELKYKAKPIPVPKKQSKNKQNVDDELEEHVQEDQQHVEEDYSDMFTWKKKNGVNQNQKVFIIKGGYEQLRSTLIEKGWAENDDVWSQFYDMKWTTRMCDIHYGNLKSGQFVNHFNNNHHLTSKYGLTRRLRTLPLAHDIDADQFYPRCFDLGDQADLQNFVQNFKQNFAESKAKWFLVDSTKYEAKELEIRVVKGILERRLMSFADKVKQINNGKYPVISAEQWAIITGTDNIHIAQKEALVQQIRISSTTQPSQKTMEACGDSFAQLQQEISSLLTRIQVAQAQFKINGYRNVWIAKPNFLSRGRGIRCFNNIYDIADYCLGRDVQFVIQKYIQNPLLIDGKKFDIRQWALILDYNPPKIYFYEECYLRFCMDEYSLNNINNRFVHLANNSIQKHNKKKSINDSMWEMGEFASHVGQQNWSNIQEKIKNIVVWSIKSCEGHVTPKKRSFELIGFDFMIDQNLNPWLIECNMSPSMDSSTPITKKLVKMVLRDTGLLLSSPKFRRKVGGYTCIYEGDQDLDKFNIYKLSECNRISNSKENDE